ncbi:MAG: aminomethyltransferase family protein [Acidimicrobiales bacterium]
MTEELSRTSALADRHKSLGSGLEDWNGMGTAWEYSTDPMSEHDAIRETAGMFDMSPLKKVRVTGGDAAAVVDHAHSRDLRRLTTGQSAYGAVLTEQGTVADDAIVFKHADDNWLFVHGSGASMELLEESAANRNASIDLDDDLHIISLQGPASLDLLDTNTNIDLAPVPYFHHAHGSLFGRPTMISRTGYSGERGYELIAGADEVVALWDAIVEAGSAQGVMPASFTALDKVRVEAALLFYGYDMTDEHHPSEVGLGWALSKNGGDYRGKSPALAAVGNERFVGAGISVEHDDMIAGGETLQLDGADVGMVNSPAFSHRLNKSLALVHLQPGAAEPGTALTVVGDGVEHTATVEAIPFFDPGKTRTHG